MGLSTVYGIVKQNDASVYVESEPDQGAIFKIYWPLCEETPQNDSNLETQIQFGKRCETILFVEDDSELRNLTCSALKSFGYNVIEAEDGKGDGAAGKGAHPPVQRYFFSRVGQHAAP